MLFIRIPSHPLPRSEMNKFHLAYARQDQEVTEFLHRFENPTSINLATQSPNEP